MKSNILVSAIALAVSSLGYAADPAPVMSGGGNAGLASPSQSTGTTATALSSANKAPVRSIGTAGKGNGAGPSATPIEVASSLSTVASDAPSIKMATSGESVTFGQPVKVISSLPAGAAAPTVKEGTTPSAKGPAQKD